MWHYVALRRVGIAFIETFFLVCCGLAGYVFYFASLPSGIGEYFHVFGNALVIAVVFQFSLHLNDVYSFQGRQFSFKFIGLLFRTVVFANLAACVIYFVFPSLAIGRSVFALNLILASLFVFLWHTMIRLYLRLRLPHINLLALGVSDLALETVKEILDHPELGIRVVGFVADASDIDAVSGINAQIIGDYNDFPNLVPALGVNHIIVGLSDNRKKLPIEELLDLKARGMLIESVETFYERVTGKIPAENLRPSWLVFNTGFDTSKSVFLQKRILSVFSSIVLLLLTSPILLLAAIMIKLDSKGPVFYKQKRVGLNGRVFTLIKFRSMRQDAEKETGAVLSTPGSDSRVTKVGRFLRRTRIDELPQLYNVFRGDMDMVGPRPERPVFVEQFSKGIPYYQLRHVVKPGITGWAQVNYGYASTTEHTVEKLQYDLFYIKNMSLTLDLMTIFETIKTVLVRKGS
jgi:sugar transferase (PEP-CTERM system associated)